MRREAISVGHKTLSYVIAEPAAPPTRQRPLRTAVFLHAFPLQAAMWEPTLDAIPDGWRAVAPDMRGLGQTPLPPSDTHRMADFAGDVVDLLDRLHVTRAAVVGCSMGGYVAFELLKNAPGYVSALGLVSTRAGADSEEGRANREKMIALVDRDGVQAVATQMVSKLLGATTARDHPDLANRVRALITGNAPEGVKAAVRAMMERSDSTPLLPHIKVPTLIVHGVEDALIPPSDAELMKRAMPAAEYEPLAASGHLPNLERPAAFNTRLWQFLDML